MLTRGHLAHLNQSDSSGLAIYLDPFLNILAANSRYLPLLDRFSLAGNNIAEWMLGNPAARNKVVDFEEEARLLLSLTRGSIGRYRTAPGAKGLITRLNRYRECRRISAAGPLEVKYGRPFNYTYTVSATLTAGPLLGPSRRPNLRMPPA